MKHINDREPNYYDENGNFRLIRCYSCVDKEVGRENYLPSVASGKCTWCGWSIESEKGKVNG